MSLLLTPRIAALGTGREGWPCPHSSSDSNTHDEWKPIALCNLLSEATQAEVIEISFGANVEAWQPATGSAPPLQVEVCRHPPTSTRGG
jgi:hypothetical protein